MRRSMLAFVAGTMCGSLALSVIHTSTRVQASQGSAVVIPGAVPVVPPLQLFLSETLLGGEEQQLDGFSCAGCIVAVGTLTYGGGAFDLPNTVMPRNVALRLTGAALNTFNLLRATGVIPNPQPPVPVVPPPGQAIQKTELQIKAHPSPITLVGLDGVKK